MEELLQHLELKIKELVHQQTKLQQTNTQLYHGKSSLSRERDGLLAKQKKAISQIETLVARLKALEK